MAILAALLKNPVVISLLVAAGAWLTTMINKKRKEAERDAED
jgi:hypothetical protein